MASTIHVQKMHIPSSTAHLASIRTFVGAIGRHIGCSDETIEDLRLAVSEACGQALEQGAAPDGIDLRTSFDGERLTVEIQPTGSFELESPQGHGGLGRWALIRALFPDAARDEPIPGGVLRFTTVPDSP